MNMDKEEAINCIQDLIDVANFRGSSYVHKHNGGVDRLENVLDCLKNSAPVVHAHWIDTGNSFEDGQCRYNYWECSHCHKQISGRYGLPDYCPNCGAKMDEVE